jgi:hypothetical protein
MIALRVSFCRDIIHAPAPRLHLSLQLCRRELLATAHPEAESVATTAPASASSLTLCVQVDSVTLSLTL